MWCDVWCSVVLEESSTQGGFRIARQSKDDSSSMRALQMRQSICCIYLFRMPTGQRRRAVSRAGKVAEMSEVGYRREVRP
jgi:hypothetical protein